MQSTCLGKSRLCKGKQEHKNTGGRQQTQNPENRNNKEKRTKMIFFCHTFYAWQVVVLKVVFPPPLTKVTDWISQISFYLSVFLVVACSWSGEWLGCSRPGCDLHGRATDSSISYRNSTARSLRHTSGIYLYRKSPKHLMVRALKCGWFASFILHTQL